MHFVGESVALIIYCVFVNGDNAMEVSSKFSPVAPLLCLASVAMAIEVEYNTYFWACMQFCTGLHIIDRHGLGGFGATGSHNSVISWSGLLLRILLAGYK